MIKFEFQNQDHNDIWREIIDFCMSKPEGTSSESLQYMLAKELGIEASETACSLAAIRFQEMIMQILLGIIFMFAMASLPVLMFIQEISKLFTRYVRVEALIS